MMINNQVSRDERVHMTDDEVIVNEGEEFGEDITNGRPWAQTKSDALLHDAQVQQVKPTKSLCNKIQGAIFPMIVLGIILGLVVMLFIINNSSHSKESAPIIPYSCDTGCSVSLVESIPENLTYPSGSPVHNSTFSVWKQLITSANQSIAIASMYWTLRNKETNTSAPSANQGEEIFRLLKEAIRRGVDVRIAEDGSGSFPRVETTQLAKMGAQVKRVNFGRLLGSGVLHTKLIISDMKSFYVGSANMDWRSLTQVKEMGVHVDQCNCPIIQDVSKIFEIYWMLGGDNSSIPDPWPSDLDTHYNITNPLDMNLGANESARVFLSSSPAPLCTTSRTVDLDAILSIMADAKQYVYVAVMDYYPTTLYKRPPNKNIFWPNIDNMLRKIAFEKNVKVRLLASYWNDTRPAMVDYLRSLDDFSANIDVKVFVVPTYGNQSHIPFARVNHNKYMVTDRVAYIGTSNWSGDYFLDTAGVGMIFNQSDAEVGIRNDLTAVFERDWESVYSQDVETFKITQRQLTYATHPL